MTALQSAPSAQCYTSLPFCKNTTPVFSQLPHLSSCGCSRRDSLRERRVGARRPVLLPNRPRQHELRGHGARRRSRQVASRPPRTTGRKRMLVSLGCYHSAMRRVQQRRRERGSRHQALSTATQRAGDALRCVSCERSGGTPDAPVERDAAARRGTGDACSTDSTTRQAVSHVGWAAVVGGCGAWAMARGMTRRRLR